MSSSVAARDLKQYEGKRVLVAYTRQGHTSSDEVEGLVQSGNELGLLIKPKGKAGVEIIEASEIEEIQLAPEKPKGLTVKYVKEVELSTVRQHLLDRHGASLAEVNEMTDEQALEIHSGIDHEVADLGHRHGDKPKRTKEAKEQSEASD